MDDPRYPVGKFEAPALPLGEAERARLIAEIAEAPARLRAAVRGLDDAQLDRPYRPGGWTIRQVVHHVPDSHMNAYVRFRLALTEDEPMVKPYEEARWAELPDAATGPVDVSLMLLETLHSRWVALLRAMKPADWSRAFRHPDLGVVPLEKALALYAWHGRHHVAHVTDSLRR
jgi:uncharacterized damage-inducible protein DinB